MVYHRSSKDSSREDAKPKNIFQNDGSFLEMFKKMQETSATSSSSSSSSSTSSSLNQSPVSSASSLPSSKDITPTSSISDSVKTEPKEILQTSENEVRDMPSAIMAEKKGEESLETAPFDPRFPNTNQTKYCYQSFVDFHRCQKVKGESYEPCKYFQRVFESLCPNEWVEKWTSQLEEGSFAGNI